MCPLNERLPFTVWSDIVAAVVISQLRLLLILFVFRFNYPLQYPRVAWHNLLVVVLFYAYFFEAVSFVEPLGVSVRDLYVKVYTSDFGFGMRGSSFDDAFQSLRAKLFGAIWLEGFHICHD
jgi:hypothetical protein